MGKRKPPVRAAEPRSVRVGDSVWSKQFKTDAEVTRVSVVLHLDNGADEVYNSEDTVEVIQ